MNTKLIIKNFRVFDENGVNIEIKPMTILTGCNSSGKSSIVKAAFLLNSFMKQISDAIENGEEIELNKYKIDFTSYPNNLLGRFDKVIPNGSSSNKICLGYTVHSCMLSTDVNVELVFASDENDDLNNAYLYSISMSTDEGIFYSSDKVNGSSYNLNILKQYLPSFVQAKIVIDEVCHLYSLPIDEEEGISEEAFEKEKNILVPQLQEIGKDRIFDVVNYIRFNEIEKELKYTKDQQKLLDWTKSNDSVFYIPVLEYLRTKKRSEIKTIVESELICDGDNNTYLADRKYVFSASNKVIDDFLASQFETFDAYFKDYEQRFLENAVVSNTNLPCIGKAKIDQEYMSNTFFGLHSVRLSWAEHEPVKKSERNDIKEWEDTPLSFSILYQVVMLWNEKYSPNESAFYSGGISTAPMPGGYKAELPGLFYHHAFEMLASFAEKLLMEMISITGFENMSYVSSSRASVKKLYAMEEKDDFTALLKRYLEAKRVYQDLKGYKRPKYQVNDFMNHWIKQFGLGESISFELDEEGLGVKIRLHKSADDKGRLLSDEGYGITQLVSIILQIETAIITAKNERVNQKNGLWALDEYNTDVYHYEENTIAVEEPEIHLHPSYQSKLAEMFVDAYNKYNIHFMIETHSEYLIRKLQTLVAKEVVNAGDVSVLYVYSPNIEDRPLYVPQILSIGVKSDGRLTDSFGPGFFDEADNAAMELLTIKEQNL
ncbi:MAG: DUF3696 domain-containing protein [Bacteroidaceae bacterium]|nr:DUF3696 domain-containing protein [Bacteroidaceae bacterium]